MSRRADAIGFFWEDLPAVKPEKVEKPKRTPPERTWEHPDYLPGLEQARAFPVEIMTDMDLAIAAQCGEMLVWDLEVYSNYFLAAFMSERTGKVLCFERYDGVDFIAPKLQWVMDTFCLIDFNGNNFDIPIVSLALAGKNNAILKSATNQIIVEQCRPHDVLKRFKVKSIKPNHIDLKEHAPFGQSLKGCAGRLHVEQMQDLPFAPEAVLSEPQIAIVRWYCVKDLKSTLAFYRSVKKDIDLRIVMGKEYDLDLRSKSDAQVAEVVIEQEVRKLNGRRSSHPIIPAGTSYYYKDPGFFHFQSDLMRWVLDRVRGTRFVVGEDGKIEKPPELDGLKFQIGEGVYRMGIGGLHSSEKQLRLKTCEDYFLVDIDVASNYPKIILNQKLYPYQLGPNFLRVYQGIVDRRLQAKAQKNKTVADSLKITINGSYGKLGSSFSILYAPELLVQVTITGQLALLLLVERLELAGIPVASANTDGIVVKCPRHLADHMRAIVVQWCADTNFETEETHYNAIFSRDVNNYVAIKDNGETKRKGVFKEVGIDKNPAGEICFEAVVAMLKDGTPVEKTVRECKDIRKFVYVRRVKGGAVKDGAYLGQNVRWYYGQDAGGEIVYARNGNKVPVSDGAVPCLDLPSTFPVDVDLDRYIDDGHKLLATLGF